MTPKETDNPSTFSAAYIYQHCCVIRNCQLQLKDFPYSDFVEATRAELAKDIELMKTAIEYWGGVEKIDLWLQVKDPDHSRLIDLPDMDWSWLEKE